MDNGGKQFSASQRISARRRRRWAIIRVLLLLTAALFFTRVIVGEKMWSSIVGGFFSILCFCGLQLIEAIPKGFKAAEKKHKH
jgi:hypothetical protein